MDWLAIVPFVVLGAFLLITWNTLSPVRFIKQHRAERQKRQQEWEALMANEAEDEDDLTQGSQ